MSSGLKKTISLALILAFVFPTVFLAKPKPTEAAAGTGFLSCILNVAGVFGSVEDIADDILGGIGSYGAVPVTDAKVGSNTSSIKKSSSGNLKESKKQTFKDCVMDGLVWELVNTMIRNITASTVEWINSGFDGSPSFVTDPEGFFLDVGDQVAGSWIEGLGTLGRVLCSPFDLQIRLALGLGRMAKHYDIVRCRLSDVQKNIYNAFTAGQWGADGWSNWISISQPMNNAYGVYLYSSDDIATRIAQKAGLKQQELAWGGGFMSWSKCVEPSKDADGKIITNKATGEPVCAKYRTNTPGSVIETQLNNQLGAGERRLEIADEINEIVDALLNQAVQQVFSSGGLFGMSQSGNYSTGASYTASLMTTYENQLAAKEVTAPAGVNCAKTYKVDTATRPNGPYPVLELTEGRWQRTASQTIVYDAVGNKTCVAGGVSSMAPRECYAYVKSSVADLPPKSGKTAEQVAADFEEQVRVGCQNQVLDDPTRRALGNTALEGGEVTPPGELPPTIAQLKNFALERDTNSTPVVNGKCGASQAVDRRTYNNDPVNACNGLFWTSGNSNETVWWHVALEKPSTINYLTIYPPSANSDSNNIKTFFDGATITFKNSYGGEIQKIIVNPIGQDYVIVNNGRPIYIGAFSNEASRQADNPSGGYTYIFQSKVEKHMLDIRNVKEILVERKGQLGFTEFEAWGPEIPQAPGGPVEPTASEITMSPKEISAIPVQYRTVDANNPNGVLLGTFNVSFLSPTTPVSDIKLTFELKKVESNGTLTSIPIGQNLMFPWRTIKLLPGASGETGYEDFVFSQQFKFDPTLPAWFPIEIQNYVFYSIDRLLHYRTINENNFRLRFEVRLASPQTTTSIVSFPPPPPPSTPASQVPKPSINVSGLSSKDSVEFSRISKNTEYKLIVTAEEVASGLPIGTTAVPFTVRPK